MAKWRLFVAWMKAIPVDTVNSWRRLKRDGKISNFLDEFFCEGEHSKTRGQTGLKALLSVFLWQWDRTKRLPEHSSLRRPLGCFFPTLCVSVLCCLLFLVVHSCSVLSIALVSIWNYLLYFFYWFHQLKYEIYEGSNFVSLFITISPASRKIPVMQQSLSKCLWEKINEHMGN